MVCKQHVFALRNWAASAAKYLVEIHLEMLQQTKLQLRSRQI